MEYSADYHTFLKEGDAYFRAAVGGSRKPGRFTPETLYHIAALGMEKHLMGLLLALGVMPDNHSFYDFLDALSKLGLLNPDMKERLLMMEAMHPLCALVLTEKKPITEEHMPRVLETALVVRNFVYARLPHDKPAPKLKLKTASLAAH